MALNNVPLTGQSLGVTRVPINQNFSVIDTTFTVDHQSYNVANGGKHGKVSFLGQPLPPAIAVPPPQAGIPQLYAQTSTRTGQQELVFTHQAGYNPAAAQIIEFTSAGFATNGWAILPSGVLMKWGAATANANTATIITFPANPGVIPVFGASPFNIQLTLIGNSGSHGGAIFLQSINSATNFTVYSASGTNKLVYYLAIGIGS